MHIPGLLNTAVDFLSRLELRVTKKIRLKIREDTQTTPIEVTTSSSDVVDEEEQFFFTKADNENASDEQRLQRKEKSWQVAKEWVANEEAPSFKTSEKEVTKIDRNNMSYSFTNKMKCYQQQIYDTITTKQMRTA